MDKQQQPGQSLSRHVQRNVSDMCLTPFHYTQPRTWGIFIVVRAPNLIISGKALMNRVRIGFSDA